MSEKSRERLAMEAAEQVYRDTGTQEARVAWEKAERRAKARKMKEQQQEEASE